MRVRPIVIESAISKRVCKGNADQNGGAAEKQIKDRAMPLPMYVWLHPSAKLSDSDIDTVFSWTQRERLRLIISEK